MSESIRQRFADDFSDTVCYVVLLAGTCGFAIARSVGATDVFFKDAAHIFIGLLIGVALARRSWPVGYLAIGVIIVEVVVAVVSRLH